MGKDIAVAWNAWVEFSDGKKPKFWTGRERGDAVEADNDLRNFIEKNGRPIRASGV